MFTLLFILNSTFEAKKFDSKEAAYDWAFEHDLITIVKVIPFREAGKLPNDRLKAVHLLDEYGYRGTIAITDTERVDYLRRNPTHQFADMPA